MSKKRLIESIEVKSPCSEDWNEMRGSQQVRFCSHCRLNVNNLSAMTRKQAMRLVREAEGRICVRYVKNPVDGHPVFAERLYQISRRAGAAAGVLGASLALSTLAYAQGSPVLVKRTVDAQTELVQAETANDDHASGASASVSGTITDPAGAVVANATVTLISDETKESRTVTARGDGFYEFRDLKAGSYQLHFEFRGFETKELRNITVAADNSLTRDVSLEYGEMFVTLGVVVSVEFSTPLHRAVSNDDVEEVKNLIGQGESVNAISEGHDDITPLFLAVENGSAEIAEILLSFGARVNARDSRRQTPLMRLDDDATPELVNLLFKYGAKVNLTDREKNTALILSAGSASPDVLQILINEGAKIDQQNSLGRTALMEAAEADNLENVRILLRAGASVNLKDKEDDTAWDLTTEDEIEKLLESYGAVTDEEPN